MSASLNTNNINNDLREDCCQSPDLLEDDVETNIDDEDIEDDNDQSRNNWSRWINELPSKVKDQLIYTRTPNSDNHIFWVDIYDCTASLVKKDLAKMRQVYQKVLRSGKTDEIATVKKEIQDKEDLFVKRHFNKVEYDKTLPMIKPLTPRLRKGLYYIKNSDITYNINHCPEQLKMLQALRAHRKVYSKMLRIKNMHAPLVVNELYHKEFEYHKQFLTLKNETEIPSSLKSREEPRKGLTKIHKKIMKKITLKQFTQELQSAIKRRQEMPKVLMRKMQEMTNKLNKAKKLDKANASFGNKNTMDRLFKEPSHSELSRKNLDPLDFFAQSNKYNQRHFENNKNHCARNETKTRSELQMRDQEQNPHNSYSRNWGQDHQERQPRSDESLQQSNKDGSFQMNIKIWEQPDRIWGQKIKREQNDHGGYQQERMQASKNEDYYSQYYGYTPSNTNRANCPQSSHWKQAHATKQTYNSRGPAYNVHPMEKYVPEEVNNDSYYYNDDQSNRSWRNNITPSAYRETVPQIDPTTSRETGNFKSVNSKEQYSFTRESRNDQDYCDTNYSFYQDSRRKEYDRRSYHLTFPKPSKSRNDFHNQESSFNQTSKNRRNQDRYNNSRYNQNSPEKNFRSPNFKHNSNDSRPHEYYPY